MARIVQRRLALASLAAGESLHHGLARFIGNAAARVGLPGGFAIVELGAAALRPSATFGGRRVMVLPEPQWQGFWIAIVGIGLAADPKKRQTLTVARWRRRGHEIAFALEPKRSSRAAADGRAAACRSFAAGPGALRARARRTSPT